MDDTTILGKALGQVGQTVKQGARQVVKLPVEAAQEAGKQVVGSAKQNADEKKASDNKSQWQSDEERIRFLRGLYGSSQPSPEATAGKAERPGLESNKNQKPSEFEKQIKDKTPEEQEELVELRNKLHKETYYQPLVNPPKPKEERPAEKVEKEKKQEMAELEQKEAKKPPPLAVQREQSKAEMFRGVAG